MKWIPVICFFFSWSLLFSQQTTLLEYAAVTHFNWNMFKGKVNLQHLDEMGDNTQAVTVSNLSYVTSEITATSANVKIVAEFNPMESWTRYPKMDRQEIALDHEKRHFDITEIYARKIRKAIASAHFTSGNFNDSLNSLFKNLTSQHRAEQNKYDHETRHSMDAIQQQKWSRRIDDQLEALSAYADPTLRISFTK